MLDHHLQRAIVYQLAFTSGARFSELKPDDIESKLFTYHLKKVVSAGYIAKADDGTYSLTSEGRLGFQAMKSHLFMLDTAYSVLFLIVRRKYDGAWLLLQRSAHPLKDYTVLPSALPTATMDATRAAQRDLLSKTGLHARFHVAGSGYLHVYRESELESFTNFTLLVCEDTQGELLQLDKNGTYSWVKEPEFTAPTMFPSVSLLVDAYQEGGPFFLETTINL